MVLTKTSVGCFVVRSMLAFTFLLTGTFTGLSYSQQSERSVDLESAEPETSADLVEETTEKNGSDTSTIPEAEEVIDRFIRALGGYEILAGTESTRIVSRCDRPNGGGYEYEGYRIDGHYSGTYRYDNGSEMSRGVSQGKGWQRDTAGSLKEFVGEELKEYIRQTVYVNPAVKWLETYESIQCKGIEIIGENETYHLHFIHPDGKVIDKYFDVGTGLLVKSVAMEHYGAPQHVVREVLKWEQMGQRMVATQSRVTYDKATVYDWQMLEYEPNAFVPEGTFDIPSELIDLDEEPNDEPNEESAGEDEPDEAAEEVGSVN